MNGYGGYENEGGFGSQGYTGTQGTPSRGGTADGTRPRRNYDEQTLIPVTVKMLTDACAGPGNNGHADLHLKDGRPIHMVKVVGAVRNAESRSTNIVFDLEDGTGLISVKVWVNEGDDPSGLVQLRHEACKEHVYIRAVGQLKEYDGQRQIVASDIRPVSSGNEVTYHFLEVAHSWEKSQKRDQIVSAPGIGNNNFGTSAMGGVGFGTGGMSNLTPMHGMTPQTGMGGGSALNDAVLQFIQAEGRGKDSGVSIDSIVHSLSPKGFQPKDIDGAIHFLSNEGHIYSTIDERHFQYAE